MHDVPYFAFKEERCVDGFFSSLGVDLTTFAAHHIFLTVSQTLIKK